MSIPLPTRTQGHADGRPDVQPAGAPADFTAPSRSARSQHAWSARPLWRRSMRHGLGWLGLLAGLGWTGLAAAAPVTYTVDADHTFPSFEADHMGLSVWRGKMTTSSGTITYDKADGSGSVDITIDADSIDFGQKQLNNWGRGDQFLDAKQHPSARYSGRFAAPKDGVSTRLLGQLTLRGVTKPVDLDIGWIRCRTHPLLRREVCGADASGSFQRDAFGLDMGKDYGFDMQVRLRIQVEALAPR